MGKIIHTSNDLPTGCRIHEITEYGRSKLVVQRQNWLLPFWTTVKKLCIDMHTSGTTSHFKADYSTRFSDRHNREYRIVESDGNCESYREALEFASYEPLKIHMINSSDEKVYRIWANNDIAKNMMSGNVPPSRIGLFYGALDSSFEPVTEFWEEFFSERYGFSKIS